MSKLSEQVIKESMACPEDIPEEIWEFVKKTSKCPNKFRPSYIRSKILRPMEKNSWTFEEWKAEMHRRITDPTFEELVGEAKARETEERIKKYGTGPDAYYREKEGAPWPFTGD